MSGDATVRLFVYGTLMRGESNHALLDGAHALGPRATARRYALVCCDEYPAMLEGGSAAITGELYEVHASRLAALDEYEGVPELFVRGEVTLAEGDTAVAYLLPESRAEGHAVIASGDWRRRDDERLR